jgi:hypothetical protein
MNNPKYFLLIGVFDYEGESWLECFETKEEAEKARYDYKEQGKYTFDSYHIEDLRDWIFNGKKNIDWIQIVHN